MSLPFSGIIVIPGFSLFRYSVISLFRHFVISLFRHFVIPSSLHPLHQEGP